MPRQVSPAAAPHSHCSARTSSPRHSTKATSPPASNATKLGSGRTCMSARRVWAPAPTSSYQRPGTRSKHATSESAPSFPGDSVALDHVTEQDHPEAGQGVLELRPVVFAGRVDAGGFRIEPGGELSDPVQARDDCRTLQRRT